MARAAILHYTGSHTRHFVTTLDEDHHSLHNFLFLYLLLFKIPWVLEVVGWFPPDCILLALGKRVCRGSCPAFAFLKLLQRLTFFNFSAGADQCCDSRGGLLEFCFLPIGFLSYASYI